jgi:hypothetical protein
VVAPADDDLTKAGLTAVLRDIRAQARSQFLNATSAEAIKAQDELVDCLRPMRMSNLHLRRCEARASERHGMGLFATYTGY